MRHRGSLLAICGTFLIVSACSPAAPSRTDTPSVAISAGAISAADAFVADLTSQSLFSGSVLISQHGHVLLSKGYGLADRAGKIPNGPQTRFRIGSVTKQFTAAAILLLEVQGKLKVTDRICLYVPQCPTTWDAITIKHLLTHTSGIPRDFSGYLDQSSGSWTALQLITLLWDQPLNFAPGTKWEYSNAGYAVLGYIIEQVSGLSYEAFLQQRIFTPLNLRDTGYDHGSNGLAVGYQGGTETQPVTPMDMASTFACGDLYSTVEDMNRWEQALTTDALLPATSRAQMFASQAAMDDGADAAGYGYGFVIETEAGRRVFWHNGAINGFNSVEARYPDDDVIIIVLSNSESVNSETVEQVISGKIFGD